MILLKCRNTTCPVQCLDFCNLTIPGWPAGEGHKAAKLRVKQQKVAGVAKVIGVSKLKGKYEPFEAKRQLCNSYDLFLADDRVVPSLPKLIGEHPAMHILLRLYVSAYCPLIKTDQKHCLRRKTPA